MSTQKDIARVRAWEQVNPGKHDTYCRNAQWKRTGIRNVDGSRFTTVDFDRAYQIQQGKCLGCGRHQSELSGRLHADHDHKTGVFRFLLCGRCNQAIGLAQDNPTVLRRLADLIERC